MLYGGGGLFLLQLCMGVYCTINVITTPESEVRNLPKLLWLLIVLFVPIVGGIAWLVAGRPQGPARSLPYKGNAGISPAYNRYNRPKRASAAAPDDDEAFLRGLRERAEQQRRTAEQQRRAAEQQREQRENDAG